MSNITNLFDFSRSLPPPFDTLTKKKVSVSSKYGDGTQSTLCATVIKAVNMLCKINNLAEKGAVGVMVGLNSLLEQTGSITLPTGEIIKRHPDAVVVVTTNISYEGCQGMNQSVLDRMNLVHDIEAPTPDIMIQRAMSVTGATDEYEVGQMVQVVNDISEYCRKNNITDGSCGMRSLIDWIISSQITGNVYESALYTIISKATSEESEREAIIASVLEPIFAPPRKKAV